MWHQLLQQSSALSRLRGHLGLYSTGVYSQHTQVFDFRQTLIKKLFLSSESLKQKLYRLQRIIQVFAAQYFEVSTNFVFPEELQEWHILLVENVDVVIGLGQLSIDYLAMVLIKRALQKPLLTV